MDQCMYLIQLGVSFVNLKDRRKITHRLKTYSQKPLQMFDETKVETHFDDFSLN